jgi:hypothetical protein
MKLRDVNKVYPTWFWLSASVLNAGLVLFVSGAIGKGAAFSLALCLAELYDRWAEE